MTPGGFYLLFCRDLTCVCGHMCVFVCAFSLCSCSRAYRVHVCAISWISPKCVLAKAPTLRFLSDITDIYHLFRFAVSRWIKYYVSPIGRHCEKSKNKSCPPFFSPPFCLCIWIYFIIQPQHVWQGVWCFCDGEILNEPWRNAMLLGEFAGPQQLLREEREGETG